jgi:large repetitive protein
VSQAYTIRVNPVACPTITISPATLPSASFGIPYSQTISASGGTAPYTFTVTTGSLPPGFTLTSTGPSSVLLSGTPTTVGTYNFTMMATDANGCPNALGTMFTIVVVVSTNIPTLSGWGLMIFTMLLGLVSIHYVRRS